MANDNKIPTNWMSDGNSKLKATAKARGVKVLVWGIPAYRTASGAVTCPMADTCATGCYATQGAYVWSNVAAAFERRYALSCTDDFVPTISAELARRKPNYVRIHDSGDYFSAKYASSWFTIMRLFPNVRFYSYTKMVPMFQQLAKTGKLPDNFTTIYSFGGLADARINVSVERHSSVFASLSELQAHGYADATEDDLVSIDPGNHRIGLVYHGARSKTWTTTPKG